MKQINKFFLLTLILSSSAFADNIDMIKLNQQHADKSLNQCATLLLRDAFTQLHISDYVGSITSTINKKKFSDRNFKEITFSAQYNKTGTIKGNTIANFSNVNSIGNNQYSSDCNFETSFIVGKTKRVKLNYDISIPGEKIEYHRGSIRAYD